ncbi:hypothetical protein P9112_008744 [Eukaryota sp. TZLM1-RC]
MTEAPLLTVNFPDATASLLVTDPLNKIHLTSDSQIRGYVDIITHDHLEHPHLIYESISQFKALTQLINNPSTDIDLLRPQVLRRSQKVRALLATALTRVQDDPLNHPLRSTISLWHWAEIFLLHPPHIKIYAELSLWLQAELPRYDDVDFDDPSFSLALKSLVLSGQFLEASLLCGQCQAEAWQGVSWLLAQKGSIKDRKSVDFFEWQRDLEAFSKKMDFIIGEISDDDSDDLDHITSDIPKGQLLIEILGLLECDPSVISSSLSDLGRTDWMSCLSCYILLHSDDIYPFEIRRTLDKILRLSDFSTFMPDNMEPEISNFCLSVIDLDCSGTLLTSQELPFREFFNLFFSGFLHLIHPNSINLDTFSYYSMIYASTLFPIAHNGRWSLLEPFFKFKSNPYKQNLDRIILEFSKQKTVTKNLKRSLVMSSIVSCTSTLDKIYQNLGGHCLDLDYLSSAAHLFTMGKNHVKATNAYRKIGLEISNLVFADFDGDVDSSKLTQLSSIKKLIDDNDYQPAAELFTKYLEDHEFDNSNIEVILALSLPLLEAENCLLDSSTTFKLMGLLQAFGRLNPSLDAKFLNLRLALSRNLSRSLSKLFE